MYKISELASLVGLSRTALLYYEKLGLIAGQRLENGYRVYSDEDVQRVRLLQQLQSGGLTLKECKKCLEAKMDRTLVRARLQALEEEIEQKQWARALLAAMLGEGDIKSWHQYLDQLAPDAHLHWLITQGFSEKEALRLRWLSKDMNEHTDYMADFMEVFRTLEYWGPGADQDTRKAFAMLPHAPTHILEIGCGKGLATSVLADCSPAKITAIDNEQSALDRLIERFAQKGLSDRVATHCVSMTELPFSKDGFDLIWAECSAYIMGVEKALASWLPFLRAQGALVFNDMVWHTDTPSPEPVDFWAQEYPDMQSVETRLAQAQKAGYQIVDHFTQSEAAWQNYYGPLADRVAELEPDMPSSAALDDIKKEVRICNQYADEFGYHFFILAKR